MERPRKGPSIFGMTATRVKIEPPADDSTSGRPAHAGPQSA
jgi:hypothetical protein